MNRLDENALLQAAKKIPLILAAALCAAAGSLLYAMDWPAENGNLINNFGWNDRGRPGLGAVFEAEGLVGAAEDGELIFVQYGFSSASRLPAPQGAWAALDHGEGIISIYAGLDEDEKFDLPPALEKNAPLGLAGQSGWSEQRGFRFSLFDRKERRWVNPSMIISPLPDTRAPVIQAVMLRNAERRLIDPAQARNVTQGRYTILVTAADTRIGPNESPLAPYRITCVINGSEAGTLNFETYSARDGALMVYRNGLVPVTQVYGPAPGFEVGEAWLTRGQAILEIIAQDITGNLQSARYQLAVE
jgi:hypothetical protein